MGIFRLTDRITEDPVQLARARTIAEALLAEAGLTHATTVDRAAVLDLLAATVLVTAASATVAAKLEAAGARPS